MTKATANTHVEYFLDITNDVCPMTFVRTKLLIERMAPGERAELRLSGKEPLENVPRSIQDIGHTVLSLEPEPADDGADGVYRLVLQVKG